MTALTSGTGDPVRPPTVTGKVMGILGAFQPGDVRLSLTEICRRAGLPLATGHRLVAELVAGGMLERLPRGSYRVGMRLWQIGVQAPGPYELRELALPYMADLYATTRDNVQLAVLWDDKALYLERLRGPQSVPVVTRVAAELSLHATAVGKVLLAFAGDETAGRILARPLVRHTASTITDPARLAAELAEVRRLEVAYTYEEMSMGTCSVAVPIRGPHPDAGQAGQGDGDAKDGRDGRDGRDAGEDGPVVAALSLVAWRRSADLKRLTAALRAAGRALSRDLALRWPAASAS